MEHRELRTHLWNLTMGAATSVVAAACGPLVTSVETDSETASATNPGPESDTFPGVDTDTDTNPGPTVTTTPPPDCNDASDCAPGYTCQYGMCVWDYYDDCYNTGGCCYDDCCYDYYCDTDTDPWDTDTDPWDTDTYGGECQAHIDCGPQQVCNAFLLCEDPPALQPCPAGQQVTPMVLPASVSEFVSLAFVDANGDAAQDLVVGRTGGAELWLGPGDGPPIALPVPPDSTVLDATAGDLDDDGVPELIVSTDQSVLLVMIGDGPSDYDVAVTVEAAGPMVELATLQWNGDGLLDLAGRVEGGQAKLHWGDGANGFMDLYTLVADSPVTSLAPTDLDGDGYGDLVLQDEDGAKRYQGSNAGNLTHDGFLPGGFGLRRLLAGQISPGAPADVVGYTLEPTWTLLELWSNGSEPVQHTWIPSPHLAGDMGDFDGDGTTDLILGGETTIDYVLSNFSGEQALFACTSTVEHQASLAAMAVGDLDGNGRADVAIGGPPGVTVLLSQ